MMNLEAAVCHSGELCCIILTDVLYLVHHICISSFFVRRFNILKVENITIPRLGLSVFAKIKLKINIHLLKKLSSGSHQISAFHPLASFGNVNRISGMRLTNKVDDDDEDD